MLDATFEINADDEVYLIYSSKTSDSLSVCLLARSLCASCCSMFMVILAFLKKNGAFINGRRLLTQLIYFITGRIIMT